MDNAAAAALQRVIAEFGDELVHEPARLRSFLLDEAPQCKREIAALMQALEEGIPADLRRVQSGVPHHMVLTQLAQRLASERAITAEAARWAVSAWAVALGFEAVDSSDGGSNDGGDGGADHVRDDPPKRDDPMPPRPWPRPVAALLAAWQALSLKGRAIASAGVLVVLAAIGWGMSAQQPRLEINRIELAEKFVADGKKRDIYADFSARNVVVKAAEIRFVRGDGNWGAQSWTNNLNADVTTKGRASIGVISYSATRAMKSTFEFVLITQDGKRSAPFEYTFDIEAAPFAPPVITSISVPPAIHVGTEYSVAIGYEDADGDVAKIERRVIESSAKWPQEIGTQDLPTAMGKKSGNAAYLFGAPTIPFTSTVEFTLIDSHGLRSAPRRVFLNITPAPAVTPTLPNLKPNPWTPGVLPQPQPQPQPQAPQRQLNCVPPANLSAADKVTWLRRNCLRF